MGMWLSGAAGAALRGSIFSSCLPKALPALQRLIIVAEYIARQSALPQHLFNTTSAVAMFVGGALDLCFEDIAQIFDDWIGSRTHGLGLGIICFKRASSLSRVI